MATAPSAPIELPSPGGTGTGRWLLPVQVRALALGRVIGAGASAAVREVGDEPGLVAKCSLPGCAGVVAREALTLFLLRGLGVGELVGVARVPDGLVLLLERLRGQSLDTVLLADPGAREREQLAARVLFGATLLLRRLHALGLAHGDIKPEHVHIGQDGSIRLLDLGLVTRADERPSGASLAYADAVALSSTSARDAFALALTVAEILDPTLGGDGDPERGRRARLPPPFDGLLGPLLSADPARPGLGWLVRALEAAAGDSRSLGPSLVGFAGGAPGSPLPESIVRAEYLKVRLDELLALGVGASTTVRVAGRPGAWLGQTCELLEELEPWLEGNAARGAARSIDGLDRRARGRFVTALLGVPSERPATGLDDSALVERLVAALEAGKLRALSPDALDVFDEERSNAAMLDPVELALRLGATAVPRALLDRLEKERQLTAPVCARVMALLRRRGDYEAARALGADRTEDECVLELARAERLLGSVSRAVELAEQLTLCTRSDGVRAEARALLGRLAVDRGAPSDALSLLEGCPPGAAAQEVRALALAALGRLGEAEAEVERALGTTRGDEEETRLVGVLGLVAQRRLDRRAAMEHYRLATSLARRASALPEEGAYATGLAAAASDSGELEEALAAAQRAELVFDALGRTHDSARALLNQASVFAELGATVEVLPLVERGLRLATVSGDALCVGYLELCRADVTYEAASRAAAERAMGQLGSAGPGERLRALARLHRVGRIGIEEGDLLAENAPLPAASIDWWQARVEVLLDSPGASMAEARRVLERALATKSESAGVALDGRSIDGCARLSALLGDTKLEAELVARRAELARRLLAGLSDELAVYARRLPWVERALAAPRFEPGQLGEVERLLGALGGGEGLKRLLERTLDLLVLWTGAPRGMILLPAGEQLVVRAARNVERRDLPRAQLELSRSVARRAMREGRTIALVDALRDGDSQSSSVHALSLRSVLVVPLVARGRVLGVAYLDDSVRRALFGEKEQAWAGIIGTIAAIALSKERDRLMLRRALRRAERAEARAERALVQTRGELEQLEVQYGARSRAELVGEFGSIVAKSEKMLLLLDQVARVARSDVPVLIHGESGSGKELIARALVDNSARRGKPFVAENCAAVPEGLLESTLFGHRRGAFTGATADRAGLFSLADGGTLFLDEIGEMSLPMQAKLLRVLSDGEVRPVGGERSRQVDVRIIAATHRDLGELVRAGKFREDLSYRLGVVVLTVPPLRERPEDVELLVDHFVKLHDPRGDRSVSAAARRRLAEYSWPGNVRQLENEIRRALVLGGQHITARDLGLPDAAKESGGTLHEQVAVLERRLIEAALEAARGNRSQAAQALGVSRYGLLKMMGRLGIDQA